MNFVLAKWSCIILVQLFPVWLIGQPITFYQAAGVSAPLINSIDSDKIRQSWVGTEDGLAQFEDFAPIDPENLCIDPGRFGKIRCLKADLNGDVWIGNYQGMIYRLGNDCSLDSLKLPYSWDANARRQHMVLAFFSSLNERLWMVTSNQRLICINKKNQKIQCNIELPFGGQHLAVIERQGSWIATGQGLLFVNQEDKIKPYFKGHQVIWVGKVNQQLYTVFRSPQGIQFFRTETDKIRWKALEVPEEIQFAKLHAVCASKTDIYFGFGQIGRFNVFQDEWQLHPTNIEDYTFRTMALGPDRSIWVGTEGNGLFCNQLVKKPDPLATLGFIEEIKCDSLIQSGGYERSEFSMEFPIEEGHFSLWYNMFEIPDQLEIFDQEGRILFHTEIYKGQMGPTHGEGEYEIPFNSSGIRILIQGGAESTQWKFSIGCPSKH